jgi:hypothetical protein
MLVAAQIMQNREQPRSQVGARLELIEAGDRPLETVLDEIVGSIPSAGKSPGVPTKIWDLRLDRLRIIFAQPHWMPPEFVLVQ